MGLSPDSSSLKRHEKNAYWRAVRNCLTQFHGQRPAIAARKARALREKLEASDEGLAGEITYHDEPFYVACDLAGMHDLTEQENLLRQSMIVYQSILEACHW
jgi:hypothetical protein